MLMIRLSHRDNNDLHATIVLSLKEALVGFTKTLEARVIYYIIATCSSHVASGRT